MGARYTAQLFRFFAFCEKGRKKCRVFVIWIKKGIVARHLRGINIKATEGANAQRLCRSVYCYAHGAGNHPSLVNENVILGKFS